MPSGDSGKIIRGSEFETEFDNIATAIATKADAASPTFTGTVTIDGLTVNGNTTLGNAATDTVTVTADIASNLIPSADDTYNLGASGAEWNDLYVDGVAYIDTIDGFATTGNITFGDDDKAIFGAGSDLQIYHDGSNGSSVITESGGGDLLLKGSNLRLQSPTGENYFVGLNNGASYVYYDNAAKLSTTATGVDVTGTVTADGLTVEGSSSGTLNNVNFLNTDSGATTTATRIGLGITNSVGASYTYIEANEGSIDAYPHLNFYTGSSATKRLEIEDNGDISFYEDTGTTAKLFWDASAENLQLSLNGEALKLGSNSGSDDTYMSFQGLRALVGLDDSLGTITGTASSAFIKSGGGRGIAFNVNNASTSAMVLNSSGNVGIGTTAPASQLHVSTSSTGSVELARFRNEGQTNNTGFFFTTDETTKVSEIDASGSTGGNVLALATSGTERMRIDSSGNVGIGLTSNTSSDSKFQVKGSGITVSDNVTALASKNSRYFGLSQADQEVTMMYLSGTSSNNTIAIGGGTSLAEPASVVKFHTGTIGTRGPGSERVRIDSSGNVLVAKTSSSLATVGSQLQASGLIRSTVDGADALQLNRKTSDGAIANFYKDGSTVGSIGTVGADTYFEHGGTGIRLWDGNNAVTPCGTSGATEDGTRDLGVTAARWKDLYLSGGAYLGGTAAANKLDDYEEGTWTPVMSGSTSGTFSDFTAAARYTKVGRAVHVTCYLQNIDITTSAMSGNIRITGLPFSSSATGQQVVSVTYTNIWSFDETDVSIGGYIGGTTFNFMKGSSTTAITDSDEGTNTNGVLMFGITYHV